MLSYSLKINYANLKVPIRGDYPLMFDMFGKSVVFAIAHMRLTRHLPFNHIRFENTAMERLHLQALQSESLPQLSQELGLSDYLPIAVDMLPFIEDFLGMYYHKKMQNYIAFTIDGFYNLHIQLKQI